MKVILKGFFPVLYISLVMFFFSLHACSSKSLVKVQETDFLKEQLTIEEQWGLKIVAVRLTANGHMLDLRYQVINSEKAFPLLDRKIKPYLIAQATGTKLYVPDTKIGPLRQRVANPDADKTYFILFGNPGGLVKRGSQVTLVMGDFKAENLVVE
jgi:hypothetical protein